MKTADGLERKIDDFLAARRLAVVGVSRSGDQPANLIYRKLRDRGVRVFAVNPATESVEGDRCWPSLGALPEPVDGAVVATPPAATEQVVRECAEAGVPRVWMHRSFGAGSVSPAAVERCRELGIEVIAGACPMMYLPPVDPAHRCMRWLLGWTGGLPG
jgi:hypothetical protein